MYKVLSIAILNKLKKIWIKHHWKLSVWFYKWKINDWNDTINVNSFLLYCLLITNKPMIVLIEINCELFWRILISLKKLVKLIRMCISNTFCKIRSQREISPEFEVQVGLKQRDSLSPILFNLAIEKIIKEVSEWRCMELNGNMTIIPYTDDIIMLDNSQLDVIQTMEKLIKAKTKYIVISWNPEDIKNLKVEHFFVWKNFKKILSI